MEHPFFSIVIPTLDRHYLLKDTITSALLSDYPSYEVVVSDNYSTPETAETVRSFSHDPRVRYVRTEKRLPVADHFEFAWQQCKGDYVILIGDDDGFSNNLLDILARLINKYKSQVVAWDSVFYYHPDWELSKDNAVRIREHYSNCVLGLDAVGVARQYAQMAFKFLPVSTRSCFSRKLAERIRRKAGRLMWPYGPDWTGPLMLLGHMDEGPYLYIDKPLGIGGRSGKSNYAGIAKSNGKSGDKSKIVEMLDDYKKVDPLPFHDNKTLTYINVKMQAVSVVKQFLPDLFDGVQFDLKEFLKQNELDFTPLRSNPHLDDRQRRIYTDWKASLPRETVQAADREFANILSWHRKRNIKKALGRFARRCMFRPEEEYHIPPGLEEYSMSEHGVESMTDLAGILDEFTEQKTTLSAENVSTALKQDVLSFSVPIEQAIQTNTPG